MERKQTINQSDNLLLPFLTSVTEDDADFALAELLERRIQPLIEKTLRTKFHATLKPTDFNYANQDALEISSAVKLLLVSEFKKLKVNNSDRKIQNLSGYVTSVTLNAYRQYLREKYPLRQRLKNKLLYLLSHHPKFDLWEYDEGILFCGFKENRKVAQTLNLETIRTKIEQTANKDNLRENSRIIDLVKTIFELAESSMPFNDLLSVVAEIQEVKDQKKTIEILTAEKEIADFENKTQTEIERREQLKNVWKEICALPLRHRFALLLNFKDKHGDCVIALLPLLRIASVRQIAEILEFAPKEFARIWNELPWDDLKIADYLNLSRQQVINLRQSARARLARIFAEKD